MCGIVGYIGEKDARSIVISGLEKLEYRGYDSAGIALYDAHRRDFDIFKDKGRVHHMTSLVDQSYPTHFGIGHTRWATHGAPNQINSHPHMTTFGRFIIVHNGVIENVKRLMADYLPNVSYISETDTEVIIHLIECFATELTVEEAIRKTLTLLDGSYAVLIIDRQTPDRLYLAKHRSPLLIGRNEEGMTVASDVMALIGHVDEYGILEDKTFAIMSKSQIEIFDIIGKRRKADFRPLDVSPELIDKGDYEHYMLKEIEEQPSVIRRVTQKYFSDEGVHIDSQILHDMMQSDRIYIIAAGTSYHAGCVAKRYFEDISGIPTEVHVASEFAYYQPLLSKRPFFILVSQSGETADVRACLVELNRQNFISLTITNVITSTLAREATYALEIYAGPEIAVASTKAYVAQLTVLAMLAFAIGKPKFNLRQELTKVALAMEDILTYKEVLKDIVNTTLTKCHCFYIGRGIDYTVCLEAALKLKEISYIQTEGFAAGELKHGTIALIEEGSPVIGIITQEKTNLIVRSNLTEVESRGAKIVVIASEKLALPSDDIIMQEVHELLTPLVSVVPTQLLAYYGALNRGHDVDKPRNLAKSVTVE